MADPQNSPPQPHLNLMVIIAILGIVLIVLSMAFGHSVASVLRLSSAPTMTTNTAAATISALTYITPTAQFVGAGSVTSTAVTVDVPTSLPTLSKAITVMPQPGVIIAAPTQAAQSPQPKTATSQPKTATPRTKTVTPQPKTATPQIKTFTITDKQATDLARGSVPANVLQNPAVAFTSAHIEITGIATIPLLGVSGPARIVGKPEVGDEQLRIKVLSITIGGADVTQYAAPKVEEVVNGSFAQLSLGKRVQSAVLSDGGITVTYLE